MDDQLIQHRKTRQSVYFSMEFGYTGYQVALLYRYPFIY